MPRKQVGMVDDALLARVDAQAVELGQTRRTFIERTLQRELDRADSNRRALAAGSRPTAGDRGKVWASAPMPGSAALDASRCPDCGKANGVHKGDCPAHPRAGR